MAELIWQSGRADLVRTVSQTHNDLTRERLRSQAEEREARLRSIDFEALATLPAEEEEMGVEGSPAAASEPGEGLPPPEPQDAEMGGAGGEAASAAAPEEAPGNDAELDEAQAQAPESAELQKLLS